ncbi:MAG: hypothetical protein K2O73_09240 [Lachnospiraceae bacterium]|nr:hypothetical protein [Lachnospiraceae bacterium]
MIKFKVRILLPIGNGCTKAELERTLDSIAHQTYGVEDIEVISVLYTHDQELLRWLLEYPLPNHGVYEKEIQRQSLIYYDIGDISKRTWNIGLGYSLKLQPGDELYENMIETCVNVLRKKRVNGVICEAGIRSQTFSQKKLYKKSLKIGTKNKTDYLSTGALHRVFYFERGKDVTAMPNNYGQLYYDPHSWNYKFTNGTGQTFYYLSREMGVTVEPEKWMDISFAKLLAYYLVILQYIRKYEDSQYHKIQQADMGQIISTLSGMAMGMACICGLKSEVEQAEDFLLLSVLVERKTEEAEIYAAIKESLKSLDKDRLQTLLQKIMNGEAGE